MVKYTYKRGYIMKKLGRSIIVIILGLLCMVLVSCNKATPNAMANMDSLTKNMDNQSKHI